MFSLLILATKAQSNELVLEWEQHWPTYGVGGTCNFGTSNFFVGDVDNDGVMELITGGLTYSKPNYTENELQAPLRIWNWNGGTLALEQSQEWFTDDITEIKCVSLGDVNGDGHVEIVTSGGDAVYGGFQNGTKPEMAQLRIWSWNGESLNLIQKEDWTIGEGTFAWNVANADIDKDGKVEIVTVGCMYVSQLCDPDLRIWSLQTLVSSESPYFLIAVAVIACAVLVGAGTYLLVRKNRKKVTQQ